MSSCQQAVALVTYKQMMGLRLVADVLVVHVGGCRCCNSCSFANHFTLRFTLTSLSFTLEKIAVVSP